MKTLILAALAVTGLWAQPGFGGGQRGPGGAPPDPATMIAQRVKFLTDKLSLSSAQATQATTIFTTAQSAVTPLQSTMNQDRQSLQTAVKTNAAGTIDQLSASIGSLMGQITAINSKADASFYSILTADQKTTYDSSPGMGPRGMGGMGGMQGMGRRGGPPQE